MKNLPETITISIANKGRAKSGNFHPKRHNLKVLIRIYAKTGVSTTKAAAINLYISIALFYTEIALLATFYQKRYKILAFSLK
ncbi:hypothetical protein [Streptococcus henryi]|uniref:hypothetical protein n=1 Tax=Streptococcus henryi TaxID=439219 RepID=UPI001FDF9DC1|nr:hypothetical protein [Streptococcus henryi]